MLKTVLSVLVLLLMSGCATFIGDKPGQTGQTGLEQSQNEQLRIEADTLRQAVTQQQDELDRLKAESLQSAY